MAGRLGQLVVCLMTMCSIFAADPTPEWKSLLIHQLEWVGFFRHDGGNFDCSLKVRSVGPGDSDLAYVVFTSEHIDMDMSVSSDDDVLVTFKESSAWRKAPRFAGHSNIVFEGEIRPSRGYSYFMGNVSSLEKANFGTVSLRPQGVRAKVRHGDNESLKYGLSIGIPVFLAICLTVSGIVILWWAFKKGYLRHIPRAYKNFTSPRNAENNDNSNNTGDTTERSTDHEMASGGELYNIEQPGSVHI